LPSMLNRSDWQAASFILFSTFAVAFGRKTKACSRFCGNGLFR
jgi:hypothetical protein